MYGRFRTIGEKAGSERIKLILNVPYNDKGLAKSLGAYWDSNKKWWYFHFDVAFQDIIDQQEMHSNIDFSILAEFEIKEIFPKYEDNFDKLILLWVNKRKEEAIYFKENKETILAERKRIEEEEQQQMFKKYHQKEENKILKQISKLFSSEEDEEEPTIEVKEVQKKECKGFRKIS